MILSSARKTVESRRTADGSLPATRSSHGGHERASDVSHHGSFCLVRMNLHHSRFLPVLARDPGATQWARGVRVQPHVNAVEVEVVVAIR